MKLEDIFTGHLELTASERSYILAAVTEYYVRGAPGWVVKGITRGEIARNVMGKLGVLKLDRMVSPDSTELLSVEEHDALVAELYPEPK